MHGRLKARTPRELTEPSALQAAAAVQMLYCMQKKFILEQQPQPPRYLRMRVARLHWHCMSRHS